MEGLAFTTLAILLLLVGSGVWSVVEHARLNRFRRSAREQEAGARAGLILRDALIAHGKESIAVWDGESSTPLSFGGAAALIEECLAGPDAALLTPAIAELLQSGAHFNLLARSAEGCVYVLRGIPMGRHAAVFLSPGHERRSAARQTVLPGIPNDALHEGPGFDSQSDGPVPAEHSVFSGLKADAISGAREHNAPAQANYRAADDCAMDCADTFDINGTAITVFGSDRRLVFYNRSYARMWGLPESWLNARPYEDDILDRLRDMRRLPERSNFAAWKRNRRISSEQPDFQSTELWHLPESKTVRVTSRRRRRGGMISCYEDMTDRLRLETTYNAALKVHQATLDALDEAIVIFGPDGRLKGYNAAFARQWKLDEAELKGEPLLNSIATACAARFGISPLWEHIASSVTSAVSEPLMQGERFKRSDGAIVSLSLTRLPDAAMLARFADITPSRRRAREIPAEQAEAQNKRRLVRQVGRSGVERR